MKYACTECGDLWEPRWIWSGLCVDCWFKDRTEPATALAGSDLTAHECVNCGGAIDYGELCTRCDNSLSNLDTLQ